MASIVSSSVGCMTAEASNGIGKPLSKLGNVNNGGGGGGALYGDEGGALTCGAPCRLGRNGGGALEEEGVEDAEGGGGQEGGKGGGLPFIAC